jgi:hypothetical protein
LDGTHIPINIKSRNLGEQSKYDFISSKLKATTHGMYCLNFVILLLSNGFVPGVLIPLPYKRSDSQVRN